MNYKAFRILLCAVLLSGSMAGAADYTHVVVPGDSLESIARLYMKRPEDWSSLQKLNKVENPLKLPVGMAVRIPSNWLREDGVSARVGAVQGQVLHRGKALAVGSTVGSGEEITTGSNGFVSLELADGSRLVLQPRSRLRLDRLQLIQGTGVYRAQLNLLNGRVDNQVAKQKDTESGYQVQTPSALIAVRGTGFRVAAEGNVTRTEVVEGVVNASKSQGQPAVSVKAGEGLVVDAAKPIGAATPLLASPNLSGVPAQWDKPTLRLSFPAVAGAASYRAQVATDEAFRQVVAEGVFPTSEIRFVRLPAGKLWLKVRAVAANGLEGQDAVAPVTVTAAAAKGETVEFSWEAETGATGYYARILSAEGQTVWESALLKEPALKAEGLPPGDYTWYFESVKADGRRGATSEPVPFGLRPPVPKLQTPKVVGNRLPVAWTGEPGLRYELELARDESFGTPVLKQKIDGLSVALPLPPKGAYFLRLRAVDPDDFSSPWTEPLAVNISTP